MSAINNSFNTFPVLLKGKVTLSSMGLNYKENGYYTETLKNINYKLYPTVSTSAIR